MEYFVEVFTNICYPLIWTSLDRNGKSNEDMIMYFYKMKLPNL